MDIRETETALHWNYLLSLEEDLVTLFSFIEPTLDNECYALGRSINILLLWHF